METLTSQLLETARRVSDAILYVNVRDDRAHAAAMYVAELSMAQYEAARSGEEPTLKAIG